jgi:hypothetical protein
LVMSPYAWESYYPPGPKAGKKFLIDIRDSSRYNNW